MVLISPKKFKKLKLKCAKSALDSGDPKMKQSTRRQIEYVVLGGREVLGTEPYFNIINPVCNLTCFLHLNVIQRSYKLLQASLIFATLPKVSIAQKKVKNS